MSNDSRGFPWMWICVLSITLLIAAFFAFPFLRMAPMIFLSAKQIRKKEMRMQDPSTYEKVGRSLAVYCQTGPSIFPTGFVGNAWLPAVVRDLDPSYVEITESNVSIGMGGGFHHYGYDLSRDQNVSSNGVNSWTLFFYSEGGRSKLLFNFSTPTQDVVNVSSFITNALAGYQIQANLQGIDALWVQQNRISFLLQFDPSRVRQSCEQAIQEMPTHWWPRLTLALVEASHGNYEKGSTDFAKWVASNPSYSRYLHLAYFFQVMNRPDESVAAIEKAILHPIIDLPDDMTNTECRGYSAALYAFKSGKYGTTIKLCDALLPIRINGNFAKGALNSLRSAAISEQAGVSTSFESDKNVFSFNPYENVSLEALLNF